MSDDGGQPPADDDAGGGAPPSREDREGATSLLNFFNKKPPGPPPITAGPQRPSGAANSSVPQPATATYINTERVSYDGDTPLLIQMLPEISNATEVAKNGKMRDLLAVARGYATGVRANSSTTGAALWTELLTKDAQNRHALSRA